jgi:hypothetical protein
VCVCVCVCVCEHILYYCKSESSEESLMIFLSIAIIPCMAKFLSREIAVQL